MLLALVLALPVDRHRGGNHQALDQRPGCDEALKEARRGHGVELCVASDLVHGLADTHGGRQVHDTINALESPIGNLHVADVAH